MSFFRLKGNSYAIQERYTETTRPTKSNPNSSTMKKAGEIGLVLLGAGLILLAGRMASSLYASEKPSTISSKSIVTVTFPSKQELDDALAPLGMDEVAGRIHQAAKPYTFDFRFDPAAAISRLSPLRNPGVGNLLKTELFRTESLTVFYPETPRVPFNLAIAFNRREIKNLTDVTPNENSELFTTIKKIADIYKSQSTQGFVIAQFDTPKEGHQGRCVVEIIPHLPGFNKIKNILDKVDCNRYVLFRSANLSPMKTKITEEEIARQASILKRGFEEETAPLTQEEISIPFPRSREESHQEEADLILYQHLTQLLQDKGGTVENTVEVNDIMPTQVPSVIKSVPVKECAFCKNEVIDRQLVYRYQDVSVFYNMRKLAKPGSCFLILPNRHTEKVYGLTSSEIENIGLVRKALISVLKETHPECEVIIYTQDDPAVGQTVFHSHEQVVAVDPNTIAFNWTMMSLYPSGNVTNEEMATVRKEFGSKLQKKINAAIEVARQSEIPLTSG